MPTDINPPKIEDTSALRMTLIRQHWKAFLFEGILLSVLGVLAIALPIVASLAVTVMLGWMLLLSGFFGIVVSFYMRRAPGFMWSLLSAILAVVVGLLLLFNPVQGLFSLTFVLGVYFIAEGISSIMYGVSHRAALGRWGWLVGAGIIDLLLGLFIFATLPDIAGTLIGLLVGINLVIGGTSLIAMALAARTSQT